MLNENSKYRLWDRVREMHYLKYADRVKLSKFLIIKILLQNVEEGVANATDHLGPL